MCRSWHTHARSLHALSVSVKFTVAVQLQSGKNYSLLKDPIWASGLKHYPHCLNAFYSTGMTCVILGSIADLISFGSLIFYDGADDVVLGFASLTLLAPLGALTLVVRDRKPLRPVCLNVDDVSDQHANSTVFSERKAVTP